MCLTTSKSPRPDGSTGKFYQLFGEVSPFLLETFQKISEEWKLSNSFNEATITQMLKPDKDTTKKQKRRRRRKLLANITEEYRCKNSQQNTSNPNSIH